MKRIRIVHVLHSFDTGGLEKGVATLVQNASPDMEHVIVCLSKTGDSARLLPPATKLAALGKSEGNSLRFIWRLSKTLADLSPDVIHTRNWGGMDGILAARIAGIDNVIHGEHGWGVEDPNGTDIKRRLIRRFCSRWVKGYTCVSRAMASWLARQVRVSKPITQIYNGVDANEYRPAADGRKIRSTLGLPEKAFTIGIVGRLDPIKDHLTLFSAFAAVRKTYPQTQLLVVGDGPERARLEGAALPGIHFLGNRPDVPDIMKAMDLFVLSSINEGISNTLLEAMASGLPVIATRVGGNPELVDEGRTGMLVSVKDSTAMANAIQCYITHPELCRAHGKSGRERVLEGFSMETMVAAYEGVYRKHVDGRRG